MRTPTLPADPMLSRPPLGAAGKTVSSGVQKSEGKIQRRG